MTSAKPILSPAQCIAHPPGVSSREYHTLAPALKVLQQRQPVVGNSHPLQQRHASTVVQVQACPPCAENNIATKIPPIAKIGDCR